MNDALLADLRALAEKWKRPGLTCEPWDDVTDDLRDLIAKHAPKPNKCAECGHAHTPMGCTGDPTPSDLWAGVTPAACDCEPDVSERDELARSAAWVAEAIGYPVEMKMPDAPMPESLWQALVDHVHADESGRWHGNELDRDEVESWLAEEAGRRR